MYSILLYDIYLYFYASRQYSYDKERVLKHLNWSRQLSLDKRNYEIWKIILMCLNAVMSISSQDGKMFNIKLI